MTATSISEEIRRFWDDDAASYDTSPPHYPRRPQERAAWTAPLRRLLPAPPATALDAGAGTGFLPPLLARQGYQVTTADLSAAMLQILTSKAAPRGLDIDTTNADAASPPRPDLRRRRRTPSAVDLPDPGIALAAWRAAAPGGRLALIEGSSGGTGRPVSPRISRKHPANRAAVTDAQNIQLCATGPKTNLLSICGA